MLYRHPTISNSSASLQQLLLLSDEEVQQCKDDAARKAAQKLAREEAIKEQALMDLCADVDAHMSSSNFPTKSIDELGDVCVGMAKSLKVALSKNAGKTHALDIEAVRNGLKTAKTFLVDVLSIDRALGNGKFASSEAYDWMSGMHVGLYGGKSAIMNSRYGELNLHVRLWRQRVDSDWNTFMKHVCRCMAFFDALDEDSLLSYETQSNNLPSKWLLSNSKMSIIFPSKIGTCRFSDDSTAEYRNLSFLVTDIKNMLKLQESDIVMPPLFNKITHTNAGTFGLSTNSADTIKAWIKNAFSVLVSDVTTRAAALDLLDVSPEQVMKKAEEMDMRATAHSIAAATTP